MICPKCGRDYPRLLAISRKDNSQICDDCGAMEAIEEYEAQICEPADELRKALKEVNHESD